MRLLLTGVCAPIMLAWIDTRLVKRKLSWAVWVLTVVWVVGWEVAWGLAGYNDERTVVHSVSALVRSYGYVYLLLPVLLAFGLPAVTVAYISLEGDDDTPQAPLGRVVACGVAMGVVGFVFGFAAASMACTDSCM